MANKVILDAMIKRADFAQQAESVSMELGNTLKLNEITGISPTSKFLRKPDFQRETNHWTPQQVANLIKSFVSGELIPALILWKSDSYVFVIDGAHRLSALKAWVENDYGSGPLSYTFFGEEIADDQKRISENTKKIVEASVGRYSDFASLTEEQLRASPEKARIHSTIFSRSLHVQWVQGNQNVAESSFFKINSQGTALDATEELLLKNRNKSYAIAARSIVRSGTGHKYWSKFEFNQQEEIEKLAKSHFDTLFDPFVSEPIKTLDLPVGGNSSPIDALKMMMDLFLQAEGEKDLKKRLKELENDDDGSKTIAILSRNLNVIKRISGNSPGSLGLHPAVYFYNERGKHSRFLFLGVAKVIADATRNNNKQWFRKFSGQRGKIEDILISRKSLINQGLSNVNSVQRIDRVADLINFLSAEPLDDENLLDKKILGALGLKGNAGDLKIIDAPRGFSDDTKSAIYLRTALKNAPRCNICNGYLHVIKSASYDHVQPVSGGGAGSIENGQLTHPYCNTGIKGNSLG